jgi:hypothetical protein
MPVETLFISGPPEGGKSTVARLIAEHVLGRPAHYLRARLAADGHTNVICPLEPDHSGMGPGWASQYEVTYTADRVFETLPEALRKVRRQERRAFILIEADADPPLRHAYPYDYRVFVMPSPGSVHEVFRTPKAAAVALQQVMQDTAAFASEIFGLFGAAGLDDTCGVVYHEPSAENAGGPNVERLEVQESQIKQFLNSPLGGEIASRIQLQPAYHSLVEADVVLVNTGVGSSDETLDECVKRIEKLLGRIRHDTRRHSVLYWGDVMCTADPTYNKLLRRLKALIAQ